MQKDPARPIFKFRIDRVPAVQPKKMVKNTEKNGICILGTFAKSNPVFNNRFEFLMQLHFLYMLSSSIRMSYIPLEAK